MKIRISILAAFVILLCLTLSSSFPANASASFSETLCGDGSAPDYGFTENLQQPHWTVNWQGYVSESTVTEVDAILDSLNGDNVAQTMIFFKPSEQVGNRVNCAVHFLRYMKLGQPTGDRRDNGFVFLIVVQSGRIDVHYGVGLGLPALTAPDLTSLNRTAEDTYQSTGSMDQALLALVRGFDGYSRSKYAPLTAPPPQPQPLPALALPSGPLGVAALCGMICIGILVLLFVIWLFIQLSRLGITFPRSGSSGSGGSWGGFSSGGDGPTMRGGSGSGRSGRGN